MKNMYMIFAITLLFGAHLRSNNNNSCYTAHSLILPRSQSVDAARELVGWQQFINRCDSECYYSAFSLTAEYEQSFNGGKLAQYLFGSDVACGSRSCRALTISGSQSPNRGTNDWLADYFGLPTDFKSVVNFCPSIKNVIFDFDVYVGLDAWTPGLFARAHVPLVWTSWSLRPNEYVINAGSNSYVAGYMSSTTINNAQLEKSFLAATNGANGTFGDVSQDFQYGRIGGNCGPCNHVTSFSDIEFALGYNFVCCDDYHLGFELCCSAPAGNRPNLSYLFEPIVGNGHYITFGFGITAHSICWRSCDDAHTLGIWLDANVTHLFKNCQIRSFDFLGKPNSRYALLETFGSTVTNLTAGASNIAPDAQYVGQDGGLVHAINQTTFNVNTSFGVQADIAIKMAYQWCSWEFDLGYNVWIRSKEKICPLGTLPNSLFALKGDAQIYGFDAGDITVPVALSATEFGATIHSGTNTPIGTTFNSSQLNNTGIDNAQLAYDSGGTALTGPSLNVSTPTNTSLQPALLTSGNINYCGAPRALTNRLFAHLNYVGKELCTNWVPFIGTGASAEFASNCSAISQWAVWLKFGVAYN